MDAGVVLFESSDEKSVLKGAGSEIPLLLAF
jgi:hypothetical protein